MKLGALVALVAALLVAARASGADPRRAPVDAPELPPPEEVAAAVMEKLPNTIEVPEAALKGSLREMKRALRHHARDTGCSLEELTRCHEEALKRS